MSSRPVNAIRYQRLNLWKVKGTLEPNKYCSLASTCDAEQRQMLGLPMASGAQAQAQTRSKPEGKRGLSTNSNQPDEIHPFLGDPDLLLNDVTSTRYLVQGLRWGSHSAQDVAALPDGFIVFCIPLEGTTAAPVLDQPLGTRVALHCPVACTCSLPPPAGLLRRTLMSCVPGVRVTLSQTPHVSSLVFCPRFSL